jgi:hypothetical protein
LITEFGNLGDTGFPKAIVDVFGVCSLTIIRNKYLKRNIKDKITNKIDLPEKGVEREIEAETEVGSTLDLDLDLDLEE